VPGQVASDGTMSQRPPCQACGARPIRRLRRGRGARWRLNVAPPWRLPSAVMPAMRTDDAAPRLTARCRHAARLRGDEGLEKPAMPLRPKCRCRYPAAMTLSTLSATRCAQGEPALLVRRASPAWRFAHQVGEHLLYLHAIDQHHCWRRMVRRTRCGCHVRASRRAPSCGLPAASRLVSEGCLSVSPRVSELAQWRMPVFARHAMPALRFPARAKRTAIGYVAVEQLGDDPDTAPAACVGDQPITGWSSSAFGGRGWQASSPNSVEASEPGRALRPAPASSWAALSCTLGQLADEAGEVDLAAC